MRRDIRTAAAICATVIGAGFASGREIVSFFSQFGQASWLGVLAAGGGLALLIYVLSTLLQRTGARSLPELYGTLMNEACEQTMHMLYALMGLMTAAAMLAAAGELAALTLPMQQARAAGLFMTLALGILLTQRGMGALSSVGYLLLPALLIYFWMASRGTNAQNGLTLQDLTLSLPMGLLYAAFNGALCSGAIALAAHGDISPRRCAMWSGGILMILLAAGNLTMLRAQPSVRNSALPTVLLASRWGISGFFASAVCLYLAVLSTLVGMLISLRNQFERLLPGKPALSLFLPAIGALLLSVCGFEMLVSVVYPLLGWVCALSLLTLLFFFKEEKA